MPHCVVPNVGSRRISPDGINLIYVTGPLEFVQQTGEVRKNLLSDLRRSELKRCDGLAMICGSSSRIFRYMRNRRGEYNPSRAVVEAQASNLVVATPLMHNKV